MELKEGPLEFTHEMEPFLRKQGMPVRLNKGICLLLSKWVCRMHMTSYLLIFCAGVVELVSDFVVCEEGQSLSPESARILVYTVII